MPRQVFRAMLLIGVVFIGTSCRSRDAGEATTDPGARRSTTEPIGLHWIQDKRLRAVMADLSRRMQENYPGGLPEDPEQTAPREIGRALADASKLASELAKGSERLPFAIEGNAKISAEDRAGFLNEARTLRKHALELGEAAGEWRIEGMQRSLLGINATCIACHSKYRDISGEIDLPKQANGTAVRPPSSCIALR